MADSGGPTFLPRDRLREIALQSCREHVGTILDLAGAADRRAPTETRAEGRPARTDGHMNTLSEETLRACAGDKAAVVLAYVERADIAGPGSRSESTVLKLRVERTICGECPPLVEAWRYTSGGDTLLKQGRKYVVAVVRGPGFVPYGLGDFVDVPDGRESDAIEAHLEIVRRMKPAKP